MIFIGITCFVSHLSELMMAISMIRSLQTYKSGILIVIKNMINDIIVTVIITITKTSEDLLPLSGKGQRLVML